MTMTTTMVWGLLMAKYPILLPPPTELSPSQNVKGEKTTRKEKNNGLPDNDY